MHWGQDIAQSKERVHGEAEFDLRICELWYNEGSTQTRDCLNDLLVPLQALLAISMLRTRFSGWADEVRAFVDEEERYETAEHGEWRMLE